MTKIKNMKKSLNEQKFIIDNFFYWFLLIDSRVTFVARKIFFTEFFFREENLRLFKFLFFSSLRNLCKKEKKYNPKQNRRLKNYFWPFYKNRELFRLFNLLFFNEFLVYCGKQRQFQFKCVSG